jgi:hypothetical protein
MWGAPRIHGELLKLGFEIAESTVSKYMIRRRGPPSQTWRTFLCNHAEAIAAIDLCVVPTLTNTGETRPVPLTRDYQRVSRCTNAPVISSMRLHTKDRGCARQPWQVR